jgi:hypothetical protein
MQVFAQVEAQVRKQTRCKFLHCFCTVLVDVNCGFFVLFLHCFGVMVDVMAVIDDGCDGGDRWWMWVDGGVWMSMPVWM